MTSSIIAGSTPQRLISACMTGIVSSIGGRVLNWSGRSGTNRRSAGRNNDHSSHDLSPLHHLSKKTGFLFSMNALMPSFWSSLSKRAATDLPPWRFRLQWSASAYRLQLSFSPQPEQRGIFGISSKPISLRTPKVLPRRPPDSQGR